MGYNPRLDTALRNRLTGAVILVLLAVLLLPELLTGSGRKAAVQPTAVAGDGPPTQTLQVDLTDAARAPAGAAAPAPVAAAPDRAPPADEGPVTLPVPETAPKPSATAPAPVVPTPAPAAPVPAAPMTAPVVAAPAAAGKFFVQVGTFATRDRAEVLRSDLARRGFEVGINETARDTKRFYRVRVGPVADRKAAETLESKLRPLAPDRAIVVVP